MTLTDPPSLAVVPVLVGPLQVLLALLPTILLALGGLLLALLKPATFKLLLKLLWRQKLAVVGIVAVGFGAFQLVGYLRAGAGAEVHEAQSGTSAWPLFRGGPGRRGWMPDSPSPGEGGLQWTFEEEAKTFHSSPAVIGNRVYVASADKGVFRDSGAIYCLDADTGGLVWKCAPKGFRATFSSPSISGRHLVCGEGLHFTRNARIVCLDIEAGGKLLWELRTKSHVESSPAIHEDRVVVGAGDDGYYCLALEPDSEGNARVLWHVSGKRYPDAETAPLVAGGRVIVGLGLGGKAVCSLDLSDGTELWRVETPYPVFAPPSSSGDRLFVGMGNGNFIQTAEQAMADELARLRKAGVNEEEVAKAARGLGPAGELWCLDLSDGRVVWKHRTPRVPLGAAAADDREVHVADRAGTIHRLSLEGRLLGTRDVHSPVLASPALTDSCLYIVTEAGTLFALERESLRTVWEVAIGTGSPFISSPAIARGRVYVGTPSSGLACLGQPRGDGPGPVWQGHLGGPGRAGAVEPSLLSRRGSLLWRYPAGDTVGIRVIAPAACLGDRLLVPIAEGRQKGVTCLPHETRNRETPNPLWHFETPLGVWSSPATDGRLGVFLDGRQGDEGRSLHAVDVSSGAETWTLPVTADATGCLLLDRSGVLVGSSARGLTALRLDGEVLWSRELGVIRHSPVTVDTLAAAAVDAPRPALLLLDRPSGEVLWRAGLESPGVAGPVVHGHDILLATAGGVAARRLVDGAVIWRAEIGKVMSPLAAAGDWLAGITDTGVLVRLDSRTGEVLEEIRGALPGGSLLLARDALLYPSRQGLTLHRPGSRARPRRWMAVSWLGAITAPPVTAGGRVYFATDSKGLICAGEW